MPGPSTTVNMHEAKTQLSRLVELAAAGHEVVIAKAGRPMVRLVPVVPPQGRRRLGFMAGQGELTLDLKKAFADDIEAMFRD